MKKLKEILEAPLTIPVGALSSFLLLMGYFFVHIGLTVIPAFLLPLVLSPLFVVRLLSKAFPEKQGKRLY